jgi:cation diffusion facilitator CzcD-associated flavoprotein CzcO
MTTDSTTTQRPASKKSRGRIHHTRVLIIGTGFSGIGMAIRLKQHGSDDFIIVDKAAEFGGTWRENTYPGCACDIPSHMYSFSFEPNALSSQMWSGQPEILDYLKGLAVKHNLYAKTHFGQTVLSGAWDDTEHRWHIWTAAGDEYVAQFLVSGVGALHVPNFPRLDGIEKFTGTTFHSAQWNHDYDWAGKKVAVIGTGASAIQFVPEIIDEVDEMHLYQRTPAWVMPRKNFAIPTAVRNAFSVVPLIRRAARIAIYWFGEALGLGLNGHSKLMKPLEKLARANIARSIDDPELVRKLTPDYRIGCKRILGSNDYYPALAKPHATVVVDGIVEVKTNSILSGDGVEREVDAIIYGTGFHVTDGFGTLDIAGIGGKKLVQQWSEKGMETHLGITVAGFPNAFFLLGPNTGLGHNSVVFMIEQQINYVLAALSLTDAKGVQAMTVRQSAQDEFNAAIQAKLRDGIWSTGGCVSWYLDSKGINRTVWPGFTWQYWLKTRKLDPHDFELLNSVPSADASAVTR